MQVALTVNHQMRFIAPRISFLDKEIRSEARLQECPNWDFPVAMSQEYSMRFLQFVIKSS